MILTLHHLLAVTFSVCTPFALFGIWLWAMRLWSGNPPEMTAYRRDRVARAREASEDASRQVRAVRYREHKSGPAA